MQRSIYSRCVFRARIKRKAFEHLLRRGNRTSKGSSSSTRMRSRRLWSAPPSTEMIRGRHTTALWITSELDLISGKILIELGNPKRRRYVALESFNCGGRRTPKRGLQDLTAPAYQLFALQLSSLDRPSDARHTNRESVCGSPSPLRQ